jgi:hypothetical protein
MDHAIVGKSLPALCLLLLCAGAAHAQCPKGTFFVDLTTGQTYPATPPARVTLVTIAPTANPACPAGWYSAVLRLDVSPPCDEAEIAVEWEKPTAWTVHIADSPTNDGYGGDSGTTLNNAEMWINQQIMWVATNRMPGGNDDQHHQENLQLNYGAMKFTVKNQWLSWGTPYHVLNTAATKKLFAFPDTNNPAEASFLYVGLNRIVGSDLTRSGCGAQRAMITVE